MNVGQLTTAERDGYVKVFTDNGNCYILARREYDSVSTALRVYRHGKRDDPCWEGEDHHGATIMLILADVGAILDCSPEAVAAEREDAAIMRMRGGDD